MSLTHKLSTTGLFLSGLLVFVGCAERTDPYMAGETPADTVGQMDRSMTTMGDTMDHGGMAMTTEINVNEVPEARLRTIPGVSDAIVDAIVANRPFMSVTDLRDKVGNAVGVDAMTDIEDYVFVPVDPNNSDSETLQQIPGVDESVVEELTAERPYTSPEEFLAVLEPMVDESEYAMAASYLVEQ